MLTRAGDFVASIGLEVHCRLAAARKLFSDAPNRPEATLNAQVNTCVAPFDMALPGAMPVLDEQAVRLALRAGVALGCDIPPVSRFDRKHYTYRDLPKGYQITQHDHPLCREGALDLPDKSKRVRITRVQLEEDAARSVTQGGRHADQVLLDLNRAGAPLIEIVTAPDLSSAVEAVAFLKELHLLLCTIGVSRARMALGEFRCDVNVSLRPAHTPDAPLGSRCEIKNLNSFKFVHDAINAEISRQAHMLSEPGANVPPQTRGYDPKRRETFTLRPKEDAPDYRFMPEPDLAPIYTTKDQVDLIAHELPALPAARRAHYTTTLGLPERDASALASHLALADTFERTVPLTAHPRALANLLLNELPQALASTGHELTHDGPIPPAHIAEFVDMTANKSVHPGTRKKLLALMCAHPGTCSPRELLDTHRLDPLDEESLRELMQRILNAHSDLVEEYIDGKTSLEGFFIGEAMKSAHGRADPRQLRALIASLTQHKPPTNTEG